MNTRTPAENSVGDYWIILILALAAVYSVFGPASTPPTPDPGPEPTPIEISDIERAGMTAARTYLLMMADQFDTASQNLSSGNLANLDAAWDTISTQIESRRSGCFSGVGELMDKTVEADRTVQSQSLKQVADGYRRAANGIK